MTFVDRAVVAALAFMFAVIPLEGTFGVLDPLRPPIPPLVGPGGAAAIGLAMLAAAAICAVGTVRRPPPRLLVLAQLAPGTAIALAAALGFDPKTGFLAAAIAFAFGCVGLAAGRYGELPGVARLLVGAFLAAGIAAALVALAMVVLRVPAALYAYNAGRAVGVFLNPNECAAYLLLLLALAAGVLLAVRSATLRWLAGAAVVAAVPAFAWTFSRWGFAAALAGIGAYALLRPDRRAWLALVPGALLALGLALGPGSAHHDPRDEVARLVAWTTGVRTFLAFPLTGVGPFAFNRTYDAFRPPDAPGPHTPVAYDPHSLPLAYAAESGVAGLSALLFLYGVYAGAIVRALRAASAPRRTLALAIAAGLFALNVHVLLNTISLYFALSMQMLALILVVARTELDPRAA